MATKSERFVKEYYNSAALKDKPPLVLVIEEETVEPITDPKTGRTEDKSVLSFQNSPTKLILNGTNWDLVCEVTGETDSTNWPGHEIELHVDKTSMGGNRVDCVRVRAPGSGKPAPTKKKASTFTDKDAAALKATLDDELPH